MCLFLCLLDVVVRRVGDCGSIENCVSKTDGYCLHGVFYWFAVCMMVVVGLKYSNTNITTLTTTKKETAPTTFTIR